MSAGREGNVARDLDRLISGPHQAAIDFVRSNEHYVAMLQSRLLDAAVDHFGRLGFEGASTRQIAASSGTAMSSITYHFGGKEGLYLAAAEYVGEAIRERQADKLAALMADTDDASDPKKVAVDRLLAMLDSFAQMMLDPASEAWARFIVREQQSPTEAFERIYLNVMKPMTDAFVAAVRVARPDLAESDARALAVMLYGQALVLRVGRASVCRILGCHDVGEEEMALLRARLRDTAACILNGGGQ